MSFDSSMLVSQLLVLGSRRGGEESSNVEVKNVGGVTTEVLLSSKTRGGA